MSGDRWGSLLTMSMQAEVEGELLMTQLDTVFAKIGISLKHLALAVRLYNGETLTFSEIDDLKKFIAVSSANSSSS